VNVVDSSGWLSFFAGDANAGVFAPAIEDLERLVVPALSIYEVFKRTLQQRGEHDALVTAAAMRQGHVVELDADLAIAAAVLSTQERLPMADSIILATARAFTATLWTQDADFDGLDDVHFIPVASR
jgi:predicted nucleic acid-binding protein